MNLKFQLVLHFEFSIKVQANLHMYLHIVK